MAGSFLKRVVKEKQMEVERAKKRMPLEALLQSMLALPPVRNFRESLFRPQRRSLMAEIKKRVPDSRTWKPRLSLDKLVPAYELGGARAISVVTDERFFGGKLSLIEDVKKLTSLPILRKDFIIDSYQIYEARAARADALLLIAAIIPDKGLGKLVSLTNSLGMVPVVEVHTQPDLKRATRAGADVVLINNRDLATLKLNMQTVTRLAKLVPRDVSVIAASGYQEVEDLQSLTSERIRAVLIGRAVLESKEPEMFLRQWQGELDQI
jgi:indole-3-glycerol phosphate synthase